MKQLIMVSFVFFLFLFQGCAVWGLKQGVENKWRAQDFPILKERVTSQSEVVDLLGPPSQVISLHDQMVYYYLLEKTKGQGLFLILFNYKNENIIYDRAIFFFDKKGILTDYGLSSEKIPLKSAKKQPKG